jgi:PAS domain S-box-containing protein
MEQMKPKRVPRPKRGAEHTTVNHVSPSLDGHTSPTAATLPDTTEERLRALEARHQALVLATGHITWTARPLDARDAGDGREDRNGVGWEGARGDWCLFTGQDGDAARGWGWLGAVHPDDRERTRADWTAAVAARGAIEMDCRVRRQDGEYRWLLVRGVPVLEVDDTVHEWVGTATDITERKQAEVALRASETALAADLAQELADTQQIQLISTRLIQEGTLDVLYEQVLDAAIALMRADVASMQMFDRDQNALRLLAWKGFAPASAAFWEWVRVDAGCSCGEAQRTGERVIVPDVERCEFIAGTQDLEQYRLSSIRAVQSTPLLSRDGRLMGMLSTHWRIPHEPAERELRLLDVLARQAADLIERKQTEAARAYLAAIVTQADDAIASKTLDGIVTSWNASAERMFGYTAQEMIGQPILRLIPSDRHDEEAHILARLRVGERIEHFETVRMTKDGRLLDVSLTISPVRDSSGAIIGASKIVRDVTERKRLERRTHEALDALLELAAAMVTDPIDGGDLAEGSDGPQEHAPGAARHPEDDVARRFAALCSRVLACERIALVTMEPETGLLRPVAITGSSPEQERRFRAGFANLHLEDRVGADVATQLHAGEAVLIDVARLPHDDPAHLLSRHRFLMVPMCAAGVLHGYIGVNFGDDTDHYSPENRTLTLAAAQLVSIVMERTRLTCEREEAQAREMALLEANRRMDEFLHLATHELKSPLTALHATLQLVDRRLQQLLTSTPDRPPTAAGEALETVAQLVGRNQQQVRRLTRLVNDLVDAARIQADKLEIRPTPCDLAEVVREMVTEQRAVQPKRTIHLQLVEGQTVLVAADADRIGQVITNYLTNALKYSPADRPVEVTLAVDGETAHTARVFVRDHGLGIPAEEQTRVWERGHRVPGSESNSVGVGLGLGLHISREIVERHGGAVGVRSAAGQGSTFWFSLPVERTGEQP